MNPSTNPPQSPDHRVGIHIGLSSMFVKGVFLVVVGVLVGAVITYLYAAARFKTPTQSKTLTINSSGSVEILATEATISGYFTGYEKKYSTSSEAETASRELADKIKSELIAIGIPSASLTIAGYAQPDYKYDYYSVPTPSPDGVIRAPSIPSTQGYYTSVSATVTLKSDTLSKTEQAVAILQKYQLSPSTAYYAVPTEEVKSEARKNALLDAKKQVDDLADIGDVKVKKILSVKDTSAKSYQDPYYPQSNKIYLDLGSTSAPYTITLEIVYELK